MWKKVLKNQEKILKNCVKNDQKYGKWLKIEWKLTKSAQKGRKLVGNQEKMSKNKWN